MGVQNKRQVIILDELINYQGKGSDSDSDNRGLFKKIKWMGEKWESEYIKESNNQEYYTILGDNEILGMKDKGSVQSTGLTYLLRHCMSFFLESSSSNI